MIKTFTTITPLGMWECINEHFIVADKYLEPYYKGKALYSNHVVMNIMETGFPEDFDFGRYFNYTKSKWNSLVSNYIDIDELNSLKAEIGTKKEYNLSLQFKNKHGHGKSCLLSATVNKNNKGKPCITVFLRASEVTKRLAMDLLLIERVGEYLIGSKEFSTTIFCNQMFNDDLVLLMYDTHKSIKSVFREYQMVNNPDRKKILLDRLKEVKRCNPSDVKYKVHLRAVKVLRPDVYKYPKLLAKDCKLPGTV